MIAVLWDVGGVLIPDQGAKIEEKMARGLGVSLEKFSKLTTWRKKLASEGKMSLEGMYQEVAKEAGTGKDAQQLFNTHMTLYADYSGQTDLEIVKLICELHNKGRKNYFVTNTEPEVWEFNVARGLWENYPEGGVASVQIGFAKPDPELYLQAMRRLNINPEEGLFVDDKPEYVAAAANLGMETIYYPEFGQANSLRQEMHKLGII